MTVQFIGGARLLETAAGIPYTYGLIILGYLSHSIPQLVGLEPVS